MTYYSSGHKLLCAGSDDSGYKAIPVFIAWSAAQYGVSIHVWSMENHCPYFLATRGPSIIGCLAEWYNRMAVVTFSSSILINTYSRTDTLWEWRYRSMLADQAHKPPFCIRFLLRSSLYFDCLLFQSLLLLLMSLLLGKPFSALGLIFWGPLAKKPFFI